ncbi:MAG TPA: hypothetical protein VJ911_10550 [Cryomorphaceae bacterium]|nr:hypothetical protein [Cryomorphaceae bacterium]
MDNLSINIVSFDIPYPANYGGVIDVFYRIKALSELGVKIHLHCFYSDRKESAELHKYCVTVTYYKRSKSIFAALKKLPFIVASRRNAALENNLRFNDYPILFEGLHTTWLLGQDAFPDRNKLVRMHNVEHHYYKSLAAAESGFLKGMFFRSEARKLKRYQKVLNKADVIFAISDTDYTYFKERFENVERLPPFHPFPQSAYAETALPYAFYHGNLTVPENCDAVKFLVNEVFAPLEMELVVAGKGADAFGKKAFAENEKVRFVGGVSDEEMLKLAKSASLHVLPTFQSTGFKLKLIYSMLTARHVLVNSKMIAGTGAEPYCYTAETAEEFQSQIFKLFNKKLDRSEFENRLQFVERAFSNRNSALAITLFLKQLPRK